MNYAFRSDIGKRPRNEDSCRIPLKPESVPLIAVADGMGGHRGGSVASRLTIGGLMDNLPTLRGDDPVGVLKRAIQNANIDVFRAAEDDPGLKGMGSTLVCALLFENRFVAANVGDSRLYHFDGDSITQITSDHSLVAMLVKEGHITPEQALHHPNRNLITKAMGLGIRVEPDFFDRSWKRGDILLLCSDGLSGSVMPDEMREVLSKTVSLDEMADVLVSRALKNDASDNITVVLARCEGGATA